MTDSSRTWQSASPALRLLLLTSVLASSASPTLAAEEPGALEPTLLLDTEGLADDVDPGPVFAETGDIAFFYLWERDDQGTPDPVDRSDDSTRLSLWRTDGSPDGTYPLLSPNESLISAFGAPFAKANGLLFFTLCEAERPLVDVSCDSSSHVQLWRSDGTRDGTFRLDDDSRKLTGNPSPTSGAVPELGLFFFGRFKDGSGHELWASDGTVAGTRQVVNLASLGYRFPGRFTDFAGELAFEVTEATDPFGSWIGRSDGTAAGTSLVEEPFDGQIEVRTWETSGDTLFLLGLGPDQDPDSTARRATLWALRSGDSSFVQVGDLGFRRNDTALDLRTAAGKVFLRVFDRTESTVSLWGGSASPGSLAMLASGPFGGFVPSLPAVEPLYLAGGEAFLALKDDSHGIEPWISDGTPAGTHRLADICPGTCDSSPSPRAFDPGGALVFAAGDGVHGYEAWSWRPASGKVDPIGDLCPGACSGGGRLVGTLDDRLFLVARNAAGDERLWEVDPVALESRPITDLPGFRIDVFEVLDGGSEVDWGLAGSRWVFWGAREDCELCVWSLPLDAPPPPPPGPALTSDQLPGFSVKVRIGGADGLAGRAEPICIPETLCISGAVPLRSEVFVRVVGPKPNGRLWPTLVKFTTSAVEVWIEQLATGQVRYYRLEGASPGSSELPGLFDRDGFPPI